MKRVLVIGAGGIGKRHVRSFISTNRARVSICEIDPAKRKDVAETCQIDRAFSDLKDVPLNEFDLAVISAPAHVHVPIGQRLADAGISFLTEKPLSISMEGVDKLVETVRAKKLVVRVGFVRRALPLLKRFKTEVDSGQIGQVRIAYINSSSEFGKYRPDYQTTYYAKQAMGGGAILDAASHMIDLVLWMMGPVAQVSAMYDRLVLQGVECEDSLLMNLRLASGGMVNITINQFQKPRAQSLEVIGTEGNLRLVEPEQKIELAADDSGLWQSLTPGIAPASGGRTSETMLTQQASEYLDAVEAKPDELCDLESARENLRVCLAAKESYQTRRIIDL